MIDNLISFLILISACIFVILVAGFFDYIKRGPIRYKPYLQLIKEGLSPKWIIILFIIFYLICG